MLCMSSYVKVDVNMRCLFHLFFLGCGINRTCRFLHHEIKLLPSTDSQLSPAWLYFKFPQLRWVFLAWYDQCSCSVYDSLHFLFFSGPNLKTLCKIAVIQYSLEQSGLPHDIRSDQPFSSQALFGQIFDMLLLLLMLPLLYLSLLPPLCLSFFQRGKLCLIIFHLIRGFYSDFESCKNLFLIITSSNHKHKGRFKYRKIRQS